MDNRTKIAQAIRATLDLSEDTLIELETKGNLVACADAVTAALRKIVASETFSRRDDKLRNMTRAQLVRIGADVDPVEGE